MRSRGGVGHAGGLKARSAAGGAKSGAGKLGVGGGGVWLYLEGQCTSGKWEEAW